MSLLEEVTKSCYIGASAINHIRCKDYNKLRTFLCSWRKAKPFCVSIIVTRSVAHCKSWSDHNLKLQHIYIYISQSIKGRRLYTFIAQIVGYIHLFLKNENLCVRSLLLRRIFVDARCLSFTLENFLVLYDPKNGTFSKFKHELGLCL
jgi:hypothetical protein